MATRSTYLKKGTKMIIIVYGRGEDPRRAA